MKYPIQNPIKFTLTELCEKMGLKSDGGKTLAKIKRALERILRATVSSKGTFYDKKNKVWLEDTFHIYDRIIFKGETLSEGNIAETNYLFLGSWIYKA